MPDILSLHPDAFPDFWAAIPCGVPATEDACALEPVSPCRVSGYTHTTVWIPGHRKVRGRNLPAKLSLTGNSAPRPPSIAVMKPLTEKGETKGCGTVS